MTDNQESSSQMNVAFKNRRPWLIALGVAEIAIACGLLLIAALLFFVAPRFIAEGIASHRFLSVENPSFIAPGIAFVGLGVLFLSAGIGSVRCLNWARILMMTVSTAWLGMGVLSVAFVLVQVHRHGVSLSASPGLDLLIDELFVTMLALPAVFLFFYSRRSVKATCLWRHAFRQAG